ncbi:MAG: hypothetical protein WD827_08790 [Solirubrobacterales bacterium]
MPIAKRHFPLVRRASLLLVAAICLSLLFAAAAKAVIVPQRGISAIALNMTREQVIFVKGGKPDAEKLVPNEIIGQVRTMRYGATRVTFGGTRPGARVIGVETKDRNQRTGSGVGVGSTAAEVRAGVAGVQCRTEYGFSHCWKGSFLPGQRVTDFRLDEPGGRVVSVNIGFVID